MKPPPAMPNAAPHAPPRRADDAPRTAETPETTAPEERPAFRRLLNSEERTREARQSPEGAAGDTEAVASRAGGAFGHETMRVQMRMTEEAASEESGGPFRSSPWLERRAELKKAGEEGARPFPVSMGEPGRGDEVDDPEADMPEPLPSRPPMRADGEGVALPMATVLPHGAAVAGVLRADAKRADASGHAQPVAGAAAGADPEPPDPAALLRDALSGGGEASSREDGRSSAHRFASAWRDASRERQPSGLPGWRELKAEVTEGGQRTHFAPLASATGLSFAGVSSGTVEGGAIAAQVVEGLERPLAEAAETAARAAGRPASLTVRTLEIRLHPEHLGAIAAHIERRGDTLEVTLRASRRDVAEELERTAHHLADRLQTAAGQAARVQVHIAVSPPNAAAEAQQPNAQSQQQGEGGFARQDAGQGGQAAQQQPGGHHAQRREATGSVAGDGGRADGGAVDGRGTRGLYL